MRRLFFILPSLIIVGCSGGNNAADENASGQAPAGQEPRFTIRAGPVPNAQASALSGTFHLLQSGEPSSIPSNRLGGACLAFAAADLGYTQMAAKQCQKNSDCSTPGENAFGYCDVNTRSCWSRPSQPNARATLCNTGLTLNVNELTPVPAQPAPVGQFGIAPGAQVRVIACLNKAGANPGATGCGSPDGPDRIEVMGPVARVR